MMQLLATAASRFDLDIAIRSSQHSISFCDLAARVRETSAMMLSRWNRGQCLGFPGHADIPTVINFLSLLNANLIACPYDPRWPVSTADAVLKQLGIINWRPGREGEVPDVVDVDEVSIRNNNTQELATIIFSSGSTGRPKAIGHRLEAHLASASGSNQNLPLANGNTWLLSLPIFHVSGLGILFRCLISGASVAIPTEPCPLEQAIAQFEPSHLSLVPTQMMRLLGHFKTPPTFLQAVLLGGGPIPLDLISRCQSDGWPIYTTYGLSESASQVTTTGPHATTDDLFTAGRVLAGREVMIGQDDEILIRGDTLFEGYMLSDGMDPCRDEKGWFQTGDRGYIDDQQRLIVLGRRDNQFISGGENIYPEEIERALLRLSGLRQAVVVDVPDAVYGRRPVAFVECDVMEPDVWLQALGEFLPRFKLPDAFLPLPAQSGLKPNRSELRQLAARNQARSDEEAD